MNQVMNSDDNLYMFEAKQGQPRVAISGCLLGQKVRFDSGHKRDRFVTDNLSKVLDLIPVCPEIDAGMGVPCPRIHLRRIDKELRLFRSDGSMDYTDIMVDVAKRQSAGLGDRISGYIFKSKSPTCGIERVPVENSNGIKQDHTGVGLFVQYFSRLVPLVPIEEEGRLNDPLLRENFLERVYAYDRWRKLDCHNVAGFIEFHARHKLMLMARGSEAYAGLGRIVSGVTRINLKKRREEYIYEFMRILRRLATRKRHFNVLQHAMGYFKRNLDSEDKQELLDIMQACVKMQVPLAAPMALLSHHLRKHPDAYLLSQHYLEPYPVSLALRSSV